MIDWGHKLGKCVRQKMFLDVFVDEFHRMFRASSPHRECHVGPDPSAPWSDVCAALLWAASPWLCSTSLQILILKVQTSRAQGGWLVLQRWERGSVPQRRPPRFAEIWGGGGAGVERQRWKNVDHSPIFFTTVEQDEVILIINHSKCRNHLWFEPCKRQGQFYSFYPKKMCVL